MKDGDHPRYTGGAKKRDTPGETHLKILRVLLGAGRPLRSSELAERAGLFSNDLRGVGTWLRKNQYVTYTVKKVKHTFSGGAGYAMKPTAFWALADKGREYLMAGAEAE